MEFFRKLLKKKERASGEEKAVEKIAGTSAPAGAELKDERRSEAVLSGGEYASVLIRPRVTEKAVSSDGAYVFEISPRANKKMVAEAVRAIYNTMPRKVRVVRIPRKTVSARGRGRRGSRPGGKKAYVYMKKGDSIDVG